MTPMAEEKDRERKFAKDFLEKWLRAEGEEGPAEEALKTVEEALRASPDDPALLFRRGTILLDLDRFEDALAALRRVEVVAPDHPRLYVALSFALTKLGRVEEAAEAQKKALAAEASGPEERPLESGGGIDQALAGLAEDLRAQEREEEAVRGLAELEALAVGPGVVDEDDFATALARWESQGYDVGPLRKGMEKDPDRVRTAFFQFEQNVRKIQVLRDTVDALDPSGIEADIARVRALFRTPYQIWRIEAEMATLMEKADTRDRARRPRVSPPPRAPVRARPPGVTNGGPSPGRVRGLVAAGKVNGLINGLSRARAGLTNGLTNGVGVTNGLAGRRFAAEVRSRRSRILLIPAVLFLLLSLTLIVPPEAEPHRGGVRVDGEFRDWERVPGYTEPSVAGNPDVDLRGYRALWREDRLSVYGNVTGTAFRNPTGLDVWYAFLDADGNRTSGYDEGRLGADVLIEIQGGNGTVSSVQAWTHAGADRADWSGWAGLGVEVSAAARASEVEFQIDTADLEAQGIPFDNRSAALSLVLDDQVGRRSESSIVFGPRYGALEIRQGRASPSVPAGPADLLVLTFRAIGAAVNVTSISVLPALPGFSPLTVLESAPQTITLQLDATGLATGTVVSAELADVRSDRPATIVGGPARAYVGNRPPEKRVDGLFSEWNETTTDLDLVQNPDVDILEHAAIVENGTAFLFVQVSGRALGGGHEAYFRSRPTPGPAGSPGPPGLPERRPGENLVRVFYDSNLTDQGTPIGGIVADTYVEIRGRHGRVGSARSFVWTSGWTPNGSVAAIASGDGLEGSVDIPGLDLKGADYVIESRDWRQTVDRTSVGGVRGLRSTPEGVTFVGNYDATIPVRADGWIRFARGGADVGWRLPRLEVVRASGARWSADPGQTAFTPTGSGGVFQGAYDLLELDVAYDAGSTVFKETFRFDSPPAIDPEEFLLLDTPIHRHADLMVEATGEAQGDELLVNGSLSFIDGRGLVITFLPPWIADAAGDRLDLRFSWFADHLRIRVPGSWLRDAAYPVVLDPTTTYSLRNQGPSADNGEQLGFSVAVGDFNGDGYADVLTGAPSNNLGGNNHGYAYVFFGPFTADDSTPDVRMNGTEVSAQMGYSVAAGRFNGDAYWDALVARRSVGGITGPVSLFYGSASWSGLDNTPDVNFSAPSSPQSFGWAVAGGNLDNANSDDVLISEPGKDNDGGLPSADGIVHVYVSPFSATESSADFTLFPSSNASGQLGRGLAVGKIDSDAYADVVAGEPLYNTNDGRLHFYKGISFASGSGNRFPNATLSAQSALQQYGSSLSVGTLNGDAYEDLAVGAPFTTVDAGAAYLYTANSDGSGLTTGASPAATIASQSANERLGISILIADFDGDGTNGVLVGATHANAGGTRQGSVYWFDDPLSDQTPDETMSGTQTDERFGQSLGGNRFANDPETVIAIGAYNWDDTANDNDGRAVVAEIPEPGTALVAVVLLAAVGGRLLKRRRLVRKR